MKEKNENDNITLSYLNLQTPKENRGNILTFFIVLLNLIGMLPILAEPFSFPYFMAAIIPVSIIHIWAIIYVFAPYKYERSYYLLLGVYGVINTYIYFLVTQKLLYLDIGVTSILPFIIGILFFLSLLIFINWLNWKALYSGIYDKLQRKRSINLSWFSFGVLGYIVGQLILTFVYTRSIRMIIFIIVLSFLSIFTAYFSTSIHRYIFIRKHMNIVEQVSPEFGIPKKDRKEF